MPKKENYNREILVYVLILICLILLIVFLLHNSRTNYRAFRSNETYFQNNPSPRIQSWMTPYTVLRHFNINEDTIFNELNVTQNTSNLRTTISTICATQKENCSEVIAKLNNLVK